MKIVAIVQARMGSTRLPGKVLMNLGKQTVLSHVLERLKAVPLIDEVVVATTTDVKDNDIVTEAECLGVAYYRGSEHDVLSRYYEASLKHTADVVVRITSDCPLIDPTVTNSVVRFYLEQNMDYVSNTIERTFPRGMDTEVFSMSALKIAHTQAHLQFQREHVTPFFYQNPTIFNVAHFKGDVDHSEHRWTLDTVEDWDFITSVYDKCILHNVAPTYNFILEMLHLYPEICAINSGIKQKNFDDEQDIK